MVPQRRTINVTNILFKLLEKRRRVLSAAGVRLQSQKMENNNSLVRLAIMPKVIMVMIDLFSDCNKLNCNIYCDDDDMLGHYEGKLKSFQPEYEDDVAGQKLLCHIKASSFLGGS